MSKSKMQIIKKVILSVSVVMVSAFLILCTAWYFTSYKTYDSFMNKCQALEHWSIDDYSSGSGEDSDKWSYSVKRPDFFSWTGNLAVSSYEVDKKTNEVLMFTDSLIIWPKCDGAYEFGVILYEDIHEDDGVSRVEYQMYIDEKGNYLPAGDSVIDNENSKILEGHRDTVSLLLLKAKNVWDI